MIGLQSTLDVFVQDQTSPLFQYYLIEELKTDIVLTADISINDDVINVSSGHGFTAAPGETIIIREGDKLQHSTVKSVSVNAVTIVTPVSTKFTINGTKIIRGNRLLNTKGDVTEKKSYFKFYDDNATIPIDINKVVINMIHSSESDDSKFGGIAAITDYVYFRKINNIIQNLGYFNCNQCFANRGADVTYTDKAGGGLYGTRIVFDIKEIFGQVIRLDPKYDDQIEFNNPADLTDLDSMIISIIGSYTEGE